MSKGSNKAASTIVGSAIAEPAGQAPRQSGAFARLDDEVKLIRAVGELGRIVQHSKSDALRWLWSELSKLVLQKKYSYRSFFGNPPKRPREAEDRYFAQGVLARVAVERSKSWGQPLDSAAGWVSRQIGKDAHRLTDKPDELKEEILRWRKACYRAGERREGFEVLNEGVWVDLIELGDDGFKVIIRHTLDNPVL